VWVIDHLTKRQALGRNTDSPYGSAAKKQLVRGCLVRAEVKELLAPESTGRVTLWVEKDNSGRVRQFCREKLFGSFEVDATDPEWISAHIDTPSEVEAAKATKRPTELMQRVSKYLESAAHTSAHETTTLEKIKKGVIGKHSGTAWAVEVLKRESYVASRPWQQNDGRGARAEQFWLIKPYKKETDPLLSNLNSNPSPTPSQPSWEGERTFELPNPPIGVRSSEVQGEIDDDDGLAAWRQPLPPQGGAA
jgi:hypothetical protein